MTRDNGQIEALYHEMYAAMIDKDKPTLERVHDDAFSLTHMTGKRQNKAEYIGAIMDGTLNYFSEQTADLTITVTGETAVMTGRSEVSAAVFGGGSHTWRLGLTFDVKKTRSGWKLLRGVAFAW